MILGSWVCHLVPGPSDGVGRDIVTSVGTLVHNEVQVKTDCVNVTRCEPLEPILRTLLFVPLFRPSTEDRYGITEFLQSRLQGGKITGKGVPPFTFTKSE